MTRSSISLNGLWEFAPLQNPFPVDHLRAMPQWHSQPVYVPSSWRWSFDLCAEYQPYDLFHYPAEWNSVEAGLLRRRFNASIQEGERAWLIFEGVFQRSVIFVNGQKAAESTESYLPIEIDVTGLVKDGENELVVWCGPYERISTPMGTKVLSPCGSWFAGLARGIWQDVTLEYRPAVRIGDPFIRTSTRSNEIVVAVTVENRMDHPFEGHMRAWVEAEGRPVLFLPEQTAAIPVAGALDCSFTTPWVGARFWSMEDPYLYTLHCELVQAGQIIDTCSTRFGFREVWWEGHTMLLNGVRVNLRGDAWHWQGFVMQTKEYALNWYRLCREVGVNFVRLHAMPYPKVFLEAADETGMLVIDESAIYGSGKAIQADHPVFLENCRAHLEAFVRRDRNHPSVIIWSMQNEMRWVDGREGYRQAIPALTGAMKALDPTRAVLYDGDNRLVDAESCEIISMHYNIDGTVAGWDQRKPLIFGEHGAFHYVSPQVSSRFGGSDTYRSFERAMEAIAFHERLFIEYARKQEVTGLTPFNLINYCMWSLPEQETELQWDDFSTPGPKPRRIPARSLTVNNGLLPEGEYSRPAAAWKQIAAAFAPVCVINDDYDTAFFDGSTLTRSFSIYNDRMSPASVRVVACWQVGDMALPPVVKTFNQLPGERIPWQIHIDLPEVDASTCAVLSIRLYHSEQIVDQREWRYSIFPSRLKVLPAASGNGVVYIGEGSGREIIQRLLPGIRTVDWLSEDQLDGANLLIIGDRYSGRAAEIQPLLEKFNNLGGSILVLEQDHLTLGDLTLANRPFPAVFIVDQEHPVLDGLHETDLRFWFGCNPAAPGAPGVSLGAFVKPTAGDARILLECGDGDFGWGGLLWSPLIEYKLGSGIVLLNQMDLCRSFHTIPGACILLRNLLSYACSAALAVCPISVQVLALEEKTAFFEKIGLEMQPGLDLSTKPGLVALDPALLTEDLASTLRSYAANGGTLLILQAGPEHANLLMQIIDGPIHIVEKPVYQVKNGGHLLIRGVSDVDLFHMERVTYTPASHSNRKICQHAVDVTGSDWLFESSHNPWEAFFVQGKDAEYQKIAVATEIERKNHTIHCYGSVLPVGQGRIIFSQVLLESGNEKVRRIYTRLLSALNAHIHTRLLTDVRAKSDFAIDQWMGLPHEAYQDAAAMEKYFTDPEFALNNLGEGVYGWMKRLKRSDAMIKIPNSAGRLYFLSVFVNSDFNRDPSKRDAQELPDSSIVPDLYLQANCAFRLYVNGLQISAETPESPQNVVKVEDVVLSQGINRLIFVCQGGQEDICLNAWFLNKYGDPLTGLHYQLTLD